MLRVHGSMTVAQARHALQAREDVAIATLILRDSNRPLEDNKLLSAYKLDRHSTLDILVEHTPQTPASTTPAFDMGLVDPDTTFLVNIGYHPSTWHLGAPPTLETERPGQLLDGYTLLEHIGVDLPEEAVKAVCSGWEPPINCIEPEHLEEFINLTSLDLSGNNQAMAPLGCLPALQELSLACNELRSMDIREIPDTAFRHLSVLDLSYNALTADSLLELTLLPVLADLNLAGNELSALPADMSGFLSLRKLSLRRNRLGQQYSELPVPLVTAEHSQASPAITLDYAFLACLSSLLVLEELDISENHLMAIPPGLPLGFRRLKFLNASYNFIADERHLLALSEWPVVEWLDARGNLFNMEALHSEQDLVTAYPFLYCALAEPSDVKIVLAQPKPSYMHDESHVMRRLERQPASAREQKQAEKPRRRVQAITDSDELSAIFGVTEGRSTALPLGLTRSWDKLLLDDRERKMHNTLPHQDRSQMKPFSAQPAANSLQSAVRATADSDFNAVADARFGRTTESQQHNRSSAVVTTAGRGKRGDKLTQIYAQMDDIFSELEQSGGSAKDISRLMSNVTRQKQPKMGPWGPRSSRQREQREQREENQADTRVRSRRLDERTSNNMQSLLSTVQNSFQDGPSSGSNNGSKGRAVSRGGSLRGGRESKAQVKESKVSSGRGKPLYDGGVGQLLRGILDEEKAPKVPFTFKRVSTSSKTVATEEGLVPLARTQSKNYYR